MEYTHLFQILRRYGRGSGTKGGNWPVHAANRCPVRGGVWSLCGQRYDSGDTADAWKLGERGGKTVTCKRCLRILEAKGGES